MLAKASCVLAVWLCVCPLMEKDLPKWTLGAPRDSFSYPSSPSWEPRPAHLSAAPVQVYKARCAQSSSRGV